MATSTYIVGENESITDVVINATGDIANMQLILDANDYDNWTPSINAGTSIIIPSECAIKRNVINDIQYSKASNQKPNNFSTQISDLNAILNSITSVRQFENNSIFVFENNNNYNFEG